MQLVETFTHLISELSGSGNLVTAQINAGLDREEVVESSFQSWSSRLAGVGRMSGQQKTEVTTERGPLVDRPKKGARARSVERQEGCCPTWCEGDPQAKPTLPAF